jgi:galactonate dehydratase
MAVRLKRLLPDTMFANGAGRTYHPAAVMPTQYGRRWFPANRERPHARTFSRRALLRAGGVVMAAPMLAHAVARAQVPALRITGFELIPIRATARTVWLVVRLGTDAGLTGLGEASDAFGFANTTAGNAATMRAQLQSFFALIDGGSPFDIERFRQRGTPMAREGLVPATAYSALEQAMWDLAAQALEVPVHVLFGGKVRETLPVYANINRATNPRTPDGFAAAATRATGDGFRALKAAPFDGFPPAGSSEPVIDEAVERGVASVVAMRQAVGPDVAIMIDCHSFFGVDLAVRVAQRLEPQNLEWYEEPVPPEDVDDTLAIKGRIRQRMAGGELLFGLSGFAPLIERRAFDIIMPDVKHCGGLLELTHITAAAANQGVMVAPHNPSGPISTAASVHVGAGPANVTYLELQYGEVSWRPEVLVPPERVTGGSIQIPDRPGLGVQLNDAVVRERALPL